MAEDKNTEEKPKGKEVKTGWVVVEFTKDHGSTKKGDKRKYHASTAKAIVNKLKVGKIVEEITKYVPEKEVVN